MLYLESPAGVGFSYSLNKDYATDDDTVSLGVKLLVQWGKLAGDTVTRDGFGAFKVVLNFLHSITLLLIIFPMNAKVFEHYD